MGMTQEGKGQNGCTQSAHLLVHLPSALRKSPARRVLGLTKRGLRWFPTKGTQGATPINNLGDGVQRRKDQDQGPGPDANLGRLLHAVSIDLIPETVGCYGNQEALLAP